MKEIFVCSAYGGREENLVFARSYCKWVLEYDKEVNVTAPHLLYPQFLDESKPEERAKGMELGKERLRNSYEIWVFAVEGVMSSGMLDEIKHALVWCIPVRFFDATDQNDIIELKHLKNVKIPSKAELLAPRCFAKVASDAFADVAKALKEGKRYEDLQDRLESFLGAVDASESDPEKDLEWEKEYRRDRE